MAIAVLILGESGTGKSTSMRNLDPQTTSIVNVDGKPYPFKAKFPKTIVSDKSETIKNALLKTDSKVVVVDDSQFIMANEYMRRAKEVGYNKFTDIGQHFFDVVETVKQLPSDVIVFFLHHTETDQFGNIKAKTIGKMLDSTITLEGKFSIVLRTSVENGQYFFRTQNSGDDTTKSPFGMFETEKIPNDLKFVADKITAYYND